MHTAFSAATAATGADPNSAEELVTHTQRLAAKLDNPALEAVVAYATGVIERSVGHCEAAGDHFVRAVALAERTATSSCRAFCRCPDRSWR
jgi:hypothetical protein